MDLSKKEAEVRKHGYAELLSDIVAVLEQGRRSAARSVNVVLTATYWLEARTGVSALAMADRLRRTNASARKGDRFFVSGW
jgi:hypothetical protein